MKFSVLVSLAAVFSITFAAPSSRLQRRLSRRAAAHTVHDSTSKRISNSVNVESSDKSTKGNGGGFGAGGGNGGGGAGGKGSTSTKTATATTTATSSQATSSGVQYSSNWAGAVLVTPPTGETYNYVVGTFTVPTPSIPSGTSSVGDGTWSSSAWVGIDGDTCSTAILQTGVDFTVSQSGEVSYDAWYEWYPDYADDFNLDISAGDVITAYVNATTLTAGSAVLENTTTGKTVSIDLTSTSSLCGTNAEWIVEDFEEGSSLVALADFGTVTFTGCAANTAESSVGVTDATIFGIESGTSVLTKTTLSSSSEVVVSYI